MLKTKNRIGKDFRKNLSILKKGKYFVNTTHVPKSDFTVHSSPFKTL
jgi:hypothetical protein